MLKRIKLTPEDYRNSLFIWGDGVTVDTTKSREEEILEQVEKGTKMLREYENRRKREKDRIHRGRRPLSRTGRYLSITGRLEGGQER